MPTKNSRRSTNTRNSFSGTTNNYGNWNTNRYTGNTGSFSSSYYNTNSNTNTNNRTNNPTGYSQSLFSNQRKNVSAKLGSFRTIKQQFTGAGKVTAFSPSALNKWIGWINDGANVYSFTNAQFGKAFGPRLANFPPAATFRFLKQKFGSGIKAVTRGKSNTWLVCASPKVTARPFANYNW